MNRLFCLFLLLCLPFLVSAKKFATSYVSFDLLNNWHCYPEGTDWICTNKLNRKKASEAMIILTAKQKGPPDTIAHYIKHLKASREVKTKTGKMVPSKVFHIKNRQINGQVWVDGFHSGSEVPSYFTRYLITIKGGLAILITYSGHKNHYNKYAADFAKSINSLRVKDVPSGSSFAEGTIGVGNAQDYIEGMIDNEAELEGFGDEEGLGGGRGGLAFFIKKPEVLGGLIFLLILLAYIFLKKKSRRKREEKLNRSSHRHRRLDRSRRHHSSRHSRR